MSGKGQLSKAWDKTKRGWCASNETSQYEKRMMSKGRRRFDRAVIDEQDESFEEKCKRCDEAAKELAEYRADLNRRFAEMVESQEYRDYTRRRDALAKLRALPVFPGSLIAATSLSEPPGDEALSYDI